MPQSTLELGDFPQSPAFEIREGKMLIKFEQDVPEISMRGHKFKVTESPSVIVGGKKIDVGEII